MSRHRDYLFDVGRIVKQRALEAVRERNAAPRGSADREFQAARALAFNEVISIMQQEAAGFGIPLADLQLEDIDPDRDLT